VGFFARPIVLTAIPVAREAAAIPPVSTRLRLSRRKHASASFVQMPRQNGKPLSNRFVISHLTKIGQPNTPGNPQPIRKLQADSTIS
jgi:hypothetical protein